LHRPVNADETLINDKHRKGAEGQDNGHSDADFRTNGQPHGESLRVQGLGVVLS
jgi:hypothetical protein